MSQDLFDTLEGPDTVTGAFGKKPLDKSLHFLAYSGRLWEFGFRVEDGLEDFFLFGSIEG